MPIKNNELQMAFNYLSSATRAGLSIEELKKMRKARQNIKEKLDEFDELRKDLWKSFEIETDEQLAASEKKEEATAKVKEYDHQCVEVEGLNFLSHDKVIGCCPQTFNNADIDKMIEYLGV